MEKPIINTNEFGQKVIIKRTLFKNEIATKEKLILLAKFLNHNNISKNKLAKINNSTCFFRVYNYGFLSCFEGRLLQNENTNSFLEGFQNNKSIKLFTEIYKKGFEKDAPLLETLKKEVISDYKERELDSFSTLQSLLQIPYSKIIIEKDKVLNTSISDLYNLLTALLKQEKNDYLYLGKEKTSVFKNDKDNFFIDNIKNVPLDFSLIENVNYNSSFLNETLLNTYSFNTINDLNSFYLVLACLKAISLTFEQILAQSYLKCHSSINIISKNKAYISYKFENDKLYKNNSKILNINSTLPENVIYDNIEEAIRNLKLTQISLNSDLSLAIKRALLLKDLELLDSKIFDDFNLNKDDVINTFKNINKVNTFSAMKGKESND